MSTKILLKLLFKCLSLCLSVVILKLYWWATEEPEHDCSGLFLFWLKGHKVLERASNTAKQCPPFFYNVSCPCNGDSVVLHTSKVFWVTYFPEGLVAISEELQIQPVPPELEGLRKNSWAAYLLFVWKLTMRNSGGHTRAVGCIDLEVQLGGSTSEKAGGLASNMNTFAWGSRRRQWWSRRLLKKLHPR